MTLRICRECLQDATHSTGTFNAPDVCGKCFDRIIACARVGHMYVQATPGMQECKACGYLRRVQPSFLGRVWGMLK